MSRLSFLLVLVTALVGVSSATEYSRTVSYEGELVIRCGLNQDKTLTLLSHDEVDVWKITPDYADIRLHGDLYDQLRDKFTDCSVLHPSVEDLVREFENTMEKGRLNATWFEEYHRYGDIVEWYQKLANDNADIVKFVASIGKSVEGRDQPAVHITTSTDPDRKKIYFQCQIHAREWISGATCMYIASYLVENNGQDERVTNLLKDLEFIFVPFVNPDGYEYTWTNDRLWRKNRQTNPGSSCGGVDLNRNYDDHWNEGGSSSNPCSETYHGASAASEPETQNTQNYFKTNGPIIGAIDWHSFSQLILRPYGWTSADCPDETQLKDLGDNMRAKILAVHGKSYTSQKSIGLYPTSGTASDWFYGEDANKDNKGFRAAGYTIELRPVSSFPGFQLPPSEIIPNGEEMVPAIVEFAEKLSANPLNMP